MLPAAAAAAAARRSSHPALPSHSAQPRQPLLPGSRASSSHTHIPAYSTNSFTFRPVVPAAETVRAPPSDDDPADPAALFINPWGQQRSRVHPPPLNVEVEEQKRCHECRRTGRRCSGHTPCTACSSAAEKVSCRYPPTSPAGDDVDMDEPDRVPLDVAYGSQRSSVGAASGRERKRSAKKRSSLPYAMMAGRRGSEATTVSTSSRSGHMSRTSLSSISWRPSLPEHYPVEIHDDLLTRAARLDPPAGPAPPVIAPAAVAPDTAAPVFAAPPGWPSDSYTSRHPSLAYTAASIPHAPPPASDTADTVFGSSGTYLAAYSHAAPAFPLATTHGLEPSLPHFHHTAQPLPQAASGVAFTDPFTAISVASRPRPSTEVSPTHHTVPLDPVSSGDATQIHRDAAPFVMDSPPPPLPAALPISVHAPNTWYPLGSMAVHPPVQVQPMPTFDPQLAAPQHAPMHMAAFVGPASAAQRSIIPGPPHVDFSWAASTTNPSLDLACQTFPTTPDTTWLDSGFQPTTAWSGPFDDAALAAPMVPDVGETAGFSLNEVGFDWAPVPTARATSLDGSGLFQVAPWFGAPAMTTEPGPVPALAEPAARPAQPVDAPAAPVSAALGEARYTGTAMASASVYVAPSESALGLALPRTSPRFAMPSFVAGPAVAAADAPAGLLTPTSPKAEPLMLPRISLRPTPLPELHKLTVAALPSPPPEAFLEEPPFDVLLAGSDGRVDEDKLGRRFDWIVAKISDRRERERPERLARRRRLGLPDEED